MNRNQVEEQIRSVSALRAETEDQLRRSEQRLAELEDEQKELEGALMSARRAVADLDAQAEQLEHELRLAVVEEARDGFAEAVRARQAATEEAAAAARQLRAAHDRLQQSRQAVDKAHAKLRDLGVREDAPVEHEQTLLEDEWRSLAQLVEDELNARLQEQIVAAAASSGNPSDIEALPEHLQALARERRRELLRERQGLSAT
jgi:chromosome segregation ATPase